MMHRCRAGGWRGPVRLVAALLLGCWLVLALASPASAHARLIGTDPTDGALLQQPPAQVTLSFNEPVRLTSQEVRVYDADGQTVPVTARTSDADVVLELTDPAAMEPGTYVVGWFVVSTDGHPISGSLTFSVGERSDGITAPPAPPSSSGVVTAAQGTVVGAMYVGLLVAAGLAGFVALVLPGSYDGKRIRRRIRIFAHVAAGVAAAAALVAVPVASVYAQGRELSELISGFDRALVVHESLSALLVALGLTLVVVTLTDRPPTPQRRTLLLVGAVVSLLGPPLVGHTRSYQPSSLLVATDAVHLMAGATWLGGLLGLVLALRALAGREELAATTLARFSTMAAGLLLGVAATGSVLAWQILGSWSAFLDTSYGRLLLVKIGLALLVAAIGGWNRFWLLPRVRAGGFAERGRAEGPVRRSVRAEALLLVALLGVSGFLVNQSPRPAPVEVPAGRTGVQDGTLSDLEVLVLMTPRRQGPNTLLIQLQDESGEPVVTRRAPNVQLRSGDLDLGRVPVTGSDAGTWAADVLLPRAGTWEVEVGLRVSRFENPVTTVRFEVAETD